MRFPKFFALFLALVSSGCTDAGGNSMKFRDVAFSPDGRWLAAGGGDGMANPHTGVVKVWETKTWKIHDSWPKGFTSDVESVFFVSEDVVAGVSAKMTRRVFSSADPWEGMLIRSWKVSAKKELDPVFLHAYRVPGNNVGYFVPKHFVALEGHRSGGCPGVFTWPGLEKKVEFQHDDRAMLRFSHDGKRVFAVNTNAGFGQRIRVNDAETGKTLAELNLQKSGDKDNRTSVPDSAVSNDGKMFAVATTAFAANMNRPGKVYVVKSDLSETIWTLDAPVVAECIRFSPDSESLAIKQSHDTVQLYSIKTKMPTTKFENNIEGVNGWSFSSDGTWVAIASGGNAGRVRVFEVKTGKLVAELE